MMSRFPLPDIPVNWYYMPMPSLDTARQVLSAVFGHREFRPLQEEVIGSVLAGKDTVAIMPTGGGKSLCYQVPALLFDGLTIVVSPLIALMQDQVSALERLGIDAVFLNSSLDRESWRAAASRVTSGSVRLLYVAPESLAGERVLELLDGRTVSCLTIDEAHCISDWGHDFRPEYRSLSAFRSRFSPSVTLALTATATAQVRSDIVSSLKLHKPAMFVSSFNRPNIYLSVRAKSRPVHQVLEFLAEHPGQAGIIYCFSRKQVDDLVSELTVRKFAAVPYHAGLKDDVRMQNQEAFLDGSVDIVVATVAFGMGINKSDVRFVIHFDLPKSLEQYYQEIGRAGRDGKAATALLLYSYGDTRKIAFFLEEKSERESKKAVIHLKAMTDYASARTCRRNLLLSWFGETGSPAPTESVLPCCDICTRGAVDEVDVTIPAQKFMSCIVRTGERYGTGYIADILLGSRQERIVGNGHHKLSTWGIGRDLSREDWFSLCALLVDAGYVRKTGEYGVLVLTRDGRDALSAREIIALPFEKSPQPPTGRARPRLLPKRTVRRKKER